MCVTCYMQHANYNMQHVTYNMQPTTCNMQPTTCNLQHATPTYNMQHSTYNILHKTCYIKHATCNMLHKTCYMQHATVHTTCTILSHTHSPSHLLGYAHESMGEYRELYGIQGSTGHLHSPPGWIHFNANIPVLRDGGYTTWLHQYGAGERACVRNLLLIKSDGGEGWW